MDNILLVILCNDGNHRDERGYFQNKKPRTGKEDGDKDDADEEDLNDSNFDEVCMHMCMHKRTHAHT